MLHFWVAKVGVDLFAEGKSVVFESECGFV
jgi:hypothetical protein